eukprot:m.35984 g.35984  ORF g.35984 m.35984 type:complete len:418 (+) comp32197_c0_seq2:46-1299(+)
MLSSFARSFRRSPSYVFCRRLCDSTQPKNGASFGRNVRLRVASGSACAAIVSVYLLWKQKGSVAHAAERLQPSPPLLEEQQNHGGVEEAPKEKELEECENKKRKHVSFRDRRYVAYEDRIRAYSTPDKVFRYFATLKVMDSDGESFIYMTPQDFVRSITPGAVQPHGLGLDQFKRIDAKAVESFQQTDDGGIFSQIGRLISFSDYLFLLTVLSTPKRHFEIAFHMFDLNGDGNVDKQEFDKVCDVLTKKTAVGLRHRDHSAVGNVAKPVGSSLSNNLFGSDGGHKLTASNFSEFHDRLQDGVLKIEFDQYQNEDGLISELDFCKLLLTYTEFSDSKKRAFKKRVKAVFGKGKQVQCIVQDGWHFHKKYSQASFQENAGVTSAIESLLKNILCFVLSDKQGLTVLYMHGTCNGIVGRI